MGVQLKLPNRARPERAEAVTAVTHVGIVAATSPTDQSDQQTFAQLADEGCVGCAADLQGARSVRQVSSSAPDADLGGDSAGVARGIGVEPNENVACGCLSAGSQRTPFATPRAAQNDCARPELFRNLSGAILRFAINHDSGVHRTGNRSDRHAGLAASFKFGVKVLTRRPASLNGINGAPRAICIRMNTRIRCD
jgi:hypothetical protein